MPEADQDTASAASASRPVSADTSEGRSSSGDNVGAGGASISSEGVAPGGADAADVDSASAADAAAAAAAAATAFVERHTSPASDEAMRLRSDDGTHVTNLAAEERFEAWLLEHGKLRASCGKGRRCCCEPNRSFSLSARPPARRPTLVVQAPDTRKSSGPRVPGP